VGNPIQKEIKTQIQSQENDNLRDRLKILKNQNNQLLQLINKTDS
jgi:hypothetical protein